MHFSLFFDHIPIYGYVLANILLKIPLNTAKSMQIESKIRIRHDSIFDIPQANF